MLFRFLLLLVFCTKLGVAHAEAPSVSILYKRESTESSQRLDTAVQSALQTLEEKLIDSGLTVIQPPPEMYAELDRATGVIINFSSDSGLAMTVDLIRSKRPESNSDRTWAEVRLKVRVFSGRRVLASFSQNDQISFRGTAEEKAFEAAARRAAANLTEKLAEKLLNTPVPALPSPQISVTSPQPDTSTPAMPQPTRRWAILFGVSDFSQVSKLSNLEVGNLPGVAGDMQAMKKIITNYGVLPENTFYLFNKEATTAGFRKALDHIAQKSAPGDQVLIYISSHGMPKEEGISGMGYPVTYDTRINVRSTMIDFEEIQERLRNLPASRVLWIADTCHAGGAAEGMKIVEFSSRNIGVKKANNALSPELAAAIANKDMAVLTASRADQTAIDDQSSGHGLFTYFFIQALQKDGKRSIYRLYKDDLEDAVAATAKNRYQHKQQPGFARSGQGDQISF